MTKYDTKAKKTKQNKHRAPFYMASSAFPQIINKLAHKHITSLLVLAALEDCSNDYGAAMIDQSSIEACINKSSVTVQKAIRYLKVCGYIRVYLIDNHNLYIINPNMLWHSREYLRYTVAKNLKFPSITELTHKSNIKYYEAHRELKRSENSYHYFKKISKLINNKHIKSKIIASTTRQDSIRIIKKRIKGIKFSPREKQVVQFLLRKIPIKANKALKLTNKGIVNYMNKAITKGASVGYTTVAHATTKLRKNGIIIRHHRSIAFNPVYMPDSKRAIH